MMASLAAVMQKVEVGHVEAGLRTDSLYNPFPEEINRRVTGSVARLPFRADGTLRRCPASRERSGRLDFHDR